MVLLWKMMECDSAQIGWWENVGLTLDGDHYFKKYICFFLIII